MKTTHALSFVSYGRKFYEHTVKSMLHVLQQLPYDRKEKTSDLQSTRQKDRQQTSTSTVAWTSQAARRNLSSSIIGDTYA